MIDALPSQRSYVSSIKLDLNKVDISGVKIYLRDNMGSTDSWKRQGKYLFASGKYEDAIKSLNRAITKDPEDVEAWVYKGRSLYYQGKYSDAARCYDKALESDPTSEDCWNGKLQCCDKILDQGQKNAAAWDEKVEALMHLGKFEPALEIADRDLGFCLNNAPRAWNWKGDSLRALGKHEDAIKCYNKTLKQDPENEEAWVSKGKSLFLLGKGHESLRCLDKALELKPEDAKVWAMKGAVLKSLYMYPEADEANAKARALGCREQKDHKR